MQMSRMDEADFLPNDCSVFYLEKRNGWRRETINQPAGTMNADEYPQ